MPKDLIQIPTIRQWLGKPEIYETFRTVAAAYKIPDQRVEEFLDLTDAVLRGQIAADQMPGMIARAFGLDETPSQKLAADLAGHRLLPASAFLPNIESLIESWGGTVSEYPDFRISAEIQIGDDAARRILQRYEISLPEELLKRFEYLVKGYISKERSEESTLTFLQRPINIGGLELSKKAATNLLQELKNERKKLEEAKEETHPEVKKAFEKEAARQNAKDSHHEEEKAVAALKRQARKEPTEALPAPTKHVVDGRKSDAPLPPKPPKPKKETAPPPPAPKRAPKPPPPPKKKQTAVVPAPTKALAKEVPVVSGDLINEDEAKEIAKIQKKLPDTTSGSGFDASVNEALAPAADLFKKRRIPKKVFDRIATSHVKGLREGIRTESMLKEEKKLKDGDHKQIMQSLEAARSLHQGYANQPPKVSPPKPPVDAKGKQAQKDEEVLNQRHAALTRNVADQSVQSPAPSARVSAARTKEEELDLQKGKVDASRLAEAQKRSRPTKAKAKISKPTTAPQTKDAPKVTDVTYKQRLVGPVQELGGMTPADFRRISSDPAEGTRRILDKLALLESTSYEERVKGVLAWRESPLNRLYVEMARQALAKGVSIQEIATERRNGGEASLSPAEIQALVKMNAQMKF